MKYMQISTDSFSAFKFGLPVVKYLKSKQVNCVMVFSGQDYSDAKDFTEQVKKEDVKVYNVNITRSVNPVYDFKSLMDITHIIKKERPHIIHTQCSKAGIIGRVSGTLCRVPFIVHTAHDYTFYELKPCMKRTLYKVAEKITSKITDKIFYVSNNEFNIAIKHKLVNGKQGVVVGAGIDLSEYDPAVIDWKKQKMIRQLYGIKKNVLLIGCVARLVDRKGIDVLLNAIYILKNRTKKFKVLVVGGGPEEDALKKLTSKLKLEEYVQFTGFVEDPKHIPYLFSLFDIFCLPTRREGFGVVFVEAMRMGVPVVASDICPVKSVVLHNKTGLLAKVNDHPQFAENLYRFAENAELRKCLGENGKMRAVKHYDERRVMEIVYENIVEGINRKRNTNIYK